MNPLFPNNICWRFSQKEDLLPLILFPNNISLRIQVPAKKILYPPNCTLSAFPAATWIHRVCWKRRLVKVIWTKTMKNNTALIQGTNSTFVLTAFHRLLGDAIHYALAKDDGCNWTWMMLEVYKFMEKNGRFPWRNEEMERWKIDGNVGGNRVIECVLI